MNTSWRPIIALVAVAWLALCGLMAISSMHAGETHAALVWCGAGIICTIPVVLESAFGFDDRP